MNSPALISHSDAWFDEAFKVSTAVQVPTPIRSVAKRLCLEHTIRGVCDPMYIANVIAHEVGAGTGRSEFNTTAFDATSERIKKLAGHLKFAYHSCISASLEELRAVLTEELVTNQGPVSA